jgi:hypothetical protein
MSVELVEVIEHLPASKPRLRVRCSECGDVYATACWPNALKKREHCNGCEIRSRRKRGTGAPGNVLVGGGK